MGATHQNHPKRLPLIAALLLITALAALWISSPRKQEPSGANSGDPMNQVMLRLQTAEGRAEIRRNYETYCQSCHGKNLEGNPAMKAPSLQSDRLQGPEGALLMAQKIVEGGRGMPSFRGVLGKEAILELALWIRYAGVAEHSSSGVPSSPTPSSGDASWSIKGVIEWGEVARKYPSAVVFLFGKSNPSMKGPPLLVTRLAPSERVSFTLGPENAMMSGGSLLGQTLYLSARLDLDGNAMTSEGEPATPPLKITIQKDISGLVLRMK